MANIIIPKCPYKLYKALLFLNLVIITIYYITRAIYKYLKIMSKSFPGGKILIFYKRLLKYKLQ